MRQNEVPEVLESIKYIENNPKILLLVPAPTARGGISHYYETLRKELPENVIFFERGARNWPHRAGIISEYRRIITDFFSFRNLLNTNDVLLVQSSTSLGLNTTLRDGLFIWYSKKKGVKTVAFFRGWDDNVEKQIEKRYLHLFRYFFFSCDSLITLSEKVKSKLQFWGYKREITVETTLVDKELLPDIDPDFIRNRFEAMAANKKVKLLFMSRIEKRKGIYEVIEAFQRLSTNTNNEFAFQLDILGDGFEIENIKKIIKERNLKEVNLHGFKKGMEKADILMNSDVFLFPSYGEGMPNAVLEAMAAGLVTVTTPVGGLVDFFKDNIHGVFIKRPGADEIISALENILSAPEKMLAMAIKSHHFARSNFYSDIVAARLMNIFNKTIRN